MHNLARQYLLIAHAETTISIWERKGGGGGGWILAVAMAQLAKGLATDLEVAGSGPVGCCYSILSCF